MNVYIAGAKTNDTNQIENEEWKMSGSGFVVGLVAQCKIIRVVRVIRGQGNGPAHTQRIVRHWADFLKTFVCRRDVFVLYEWRFVERLRNPETEQDIVRV